MKGEPKRADLEALGAGLSPAGPPASFERDGERVA